MAVGADWEFWIDVGGTFTDCVARAPHGSLHVHKLLSNGVYKGKVSSPSTTTEIYSLERMLDPADFFVGYQIALVDETGQAIATRTVVAFSPVTGQLKLDSPLAARPTAGTQYELSSDEEAPVVGIRWLMGKRRGESLGAVQVRLGTTRGTNALLERQGTPTALVITRGFGDALRIAYQNRPRLFTLAVMLPSTLYQEVVELDERLDARGQVLQPLDQDICRSVLAPLRARGITSLAVCLLHSYRNPIHEDMVARVARELGFTQVSVSSELSPLQRLVPRGDTTVVDAYLTPILREYVGGIRAKLPQARLQLMTSAGSLIDAERFVGKDSILSGPAGGVVGVARVARQAGFSSAIGFDMGGTSTDVCRFDGEYERRYEMEVHDPTSGAGVRIVAPMLAMETVAAGGGSICDFDGQKVIVGPRSAGSAPGPACYGRGGPLCVTDVNLLLGKILPEYFAFPLDLRAAEARLDELRGQILRATGQHYERETLALGLTRVANANMASAIKKVSIARGYDVRRDVLVSFGGAGAQHACALARELGISTVLQHPFAGVLSAYGIGMADVSHFVARDVGRWYSSTTLQDLEKVFVEMEYEAQSQVLGEGVAPARLLSPRRMLDLRYQGQDAVITTPRPADGDYAVEFAHRHKQLYGFVYEHRALEIRAMRVEQTGTTDVAEPLVRPEVQRQPEPFMWTNTFFSDTWQRTAVFRRADLQPGDAMVGPAIILESISTVIVEPDWVATVTSMDHLILRDTGAVAGQASKGAIDEFSNVETFVDDHEPDAILLELFNNQFASIAAQMGATLQKTAISTNVKERLDFSCALFTPTGSLVVNAPHIPVHLGAMGATVKSLLADVEVMRPGDVFITNDPYRGGSHLPDVTVVTPVFDGLGQLQCFTASRAHHAEIGGIAPGSMPPFSRNLAEEGVLIRAFRLVQGEQSSEEELRRLFMEAPYPTRAVAENLADVNAQIAANQTGANLMHTMILREGLPRVQAYMGHIQRAAARKMRQALRRLPKGVYRFRDQLDDGTTLAVAITVVHEGASDARAVVDFTGTGPVSPYNFNANPAIVRSAVLYCFRCLIQEDIPLNDGVLEPVELRIPACSLLDPPCHPDPCHCPAVVGGNVETSQRVVDVVLGALGVAAASQGTMNNFLFGRAPQPALAGQPEQSGFGYYETIGGGAGAGPGFIGASGVHTHMTNTRITDVEVLEDRYPVRLHTFALRRGSGGAGQFPGGCGMVREIEFLAPLTVSLLTNRRLTAPYGLAGGQPGQPGRNLIRRAGAAQFEDLPPAIQVEVFPGDILRIETPGGGGFGTPE